MPRLTYRHPYHRSRELQTSRKDAERFIEDVRGDDREFAAKLGIEERELEAGELRGPTSVCPAPLALKSSVELRRLVRECSLRPGGNRKRTRRRTWNLRTRHAVHRLRRERERQLRICD